MRFKAALIFSLLIVSLVIIPQQAFASHTTDNWYSWILGLLKIPTVTPIATPTPIQSRPTSPTLTPSPTATLTPTPTRTPTPKPTSTPSSITYQTKQNYIMNAINNYRKSKNLAEVQMDTYTCNFAKLRASEIAANFNHDGFRNRINSKTLPYPSYSSVTENIAMNSDYKKVVSGWINSSGHAANMQKDTPYVCVEFSGNFYAYEGWKP